MLWTYHSSTVFYLVNDESFDHELPIWRTTCWISKIKLPYAIIFMVLLGLRFMSIIAEEIQTTLNYIQVRGVYLRKIYNKDVLVVYLNIFLPLICSVLNRAEKLAISLELRGFRKFNNRVSYRQIALSKLDYFVMASYYA